MKILFFKDLNFYLEKIKHIYPKMNDVSEPGDKFILNQSNVV